MSNFVELCIRGKALLEEIDDYVDKWHEGESKVPLHTFLGMTRNEYSLWVADPDVLPFVITAHRESRDVSDVMEELNRLPLAARAASPEKARKLAKWLKSMNLWK